MTTDKQFDDDIWTLTDEYKRQQDVKRWNAIEEQGRERLAEQAVEGGRYLVNGVLVDAEGRPLKSK